MTKPRLAALDAVRGIAAMMVVLFHLTDRYSTKFEVDYRPAVEFVFGYLGVNFFFMVSGFVIFMTLCKTETGFDFIVSRFSRLFPAYWLAVALTAAVVTASGIAALQMTPSQVAVNFTMLHGFVGVADVDGVYWTLTIELIFYAMMFAAFKLRLLGYVHVGVAAWLTFAVISHYVELPWVVTFVGLVDYAHLFAAGILFYVIYDGRGTRWTYALLALCAGDALLTATNLTESIFVMGFFAVFFAVSHHRAQLLEWRPLTFLGSISYTLYLLHHNVGFVALDWFRSAGISANVAVPILIVAAVALASLVSAYIERPAMNAIRRWRRPPDRAGQKSVIQGPN